MRKRLLKVSRLGRRHRALRRLPDLEDRPQADARTSSRNTTSRRTSSRSFALMLAATWPMAWRWQKLLAAKGVDERLGWLTRSYFSRWFVGQVLPTSLGGDASRIYQTSRRHPGKRGIAAASVLLERALGGAATLTLAAIGFVLAIGALRRRRLPLDRGSPSSLATDRARLRAVLALRAPAAAPAAPARSRACSSTSRCARSTRRCTSTARTSGCCRRLRADARRPGLARARDLARREGGRRRPLAAAVLRDGPAALPRDARAVHDQRARRARVVLRELPRQPRRRPTRPSRPASCSSSSRLRSRCRGC